MSSHPSGEIITFYSYKGGTGRSMALANVACLLSKQVEAKGHGVLMVDWDLEAPGLHRYFYNQFKNLSSKSDNNELAIELRPGLLDLFLRLESEIPKDGYRQGDREAAEHAKRLLSVISLDDYILETDIPDLYLLKAGRFDDDYSRHVNSFDWENLYTRSRWLFRALAEYWNDKYRYILIDSRTGLTDTSGICTILLPEKLVVVFTPNRQSFTGVANLMEKATNYRKNSDDVRPLSIFPLPSRIESQREQLREDWRYGNAERGIEGYQPLFEEVFHRIYHLDKSECDLDDYFAEVQIQQSPDYAYGEEIAVNVEKKHDRFSLARSYQTFTHRLTTLDLPWEQPEQPAADDSTEKDAELTAKFAEAAYQELTPEEQVSARRIFTRLVSLALPGEGGDNVKRASLSEFDEESATVINALIKSGLLAKARGENVSEESIEIANEALLRRWERLKEWIEKDREFLLWRQQLRPNMAEWEKVGRDEGALLRGSSLTIAEVWLREHNEDLNDREKLYIKSSSLLDIRETERLAAARRRRSILQLVGIFIGLMIVLFVGYKVRQLDRETSEAERLAKEQQALSRATALTDAGKQAFIKGDTDVAISNYNEAIEVKPDYDAAYLNRGYAYLNKGYKDKALADFKKALEMTQDAQTREQLKSLIQSLELPTLPTPMPSATATLSPSPSPGPSSSPMASLTPRIYVQVQDAQQLSKFRDIQAKFGPEFVFPREPLITSGPKSTQVRYYRQAEAAKANQIVKILLQLGVADADVFYVPGQENSTTSRPGHYEIWFGPNALR